jgi:hypothetical protein
MAEQGDVCSSCEFSRSMSISLGIADAENQMCTIHHIGRLEAKLAQCMKVLALIEKRNANVYWGWEIEAEFAKLKEMG